MSSSGEAGKKSERAVVLAYVPASDRAALAALLALDRTLGEVLRTTQNPIIGQMRLAWWREALQALDAASAPAEPTLAALATHVVPRGVEGRALATMVDGWEMLFCDGLDEAVLGRFAAGRGGGLFATAAMMLGEQGDMIEQAGEGWALADLASHVGDPAVAARAREMATERLAEVFAMPWRRAVRPLGMLAVLARADLAGISPGSPRRLARLLLHQLTGR